MLAMTFLKKMIKDRIFQPYFLLNFDQKMIQGPNTRGWKTSGEKRWKGKDFKKVKIGIYGIGEIGKVVAEDLNSLGFNVLGWSRVKKKFKFIKSYYSKDGFNYMIENCDIHVCLLPLTRDTRKIFDKDIFSKMLSR